MNELDLRAERARQRCSVHARCGGCPWLGWSAAEQRTRKLAELESALASLGIGSPGAQWITDERELGYRNRVRLRFDDGVPSFFNPQKDAQCSALNAELRAALNRVRSWAIPWRTQLREYEHLEVRAFDADGVLGLSLWPRAGEVARWDQLRVPTDFALGGPGQGARQRFVSSQGHYFYVPVTSFMQVNTGVNDLLVEQITQLVQASGARRCLDLFCGAGNFGLALAAVGCAVSGVESDAAALGAFRRAAAEQALDVRELVHAPAEQALQGWVARAERFDCVVANPPRAGLGRSVADCAALASRELLLCCCKVQSFARDSRALCDAGFELQALFAIDMFPGTEHLEVLGRFRRRGEA